MSIDAIANFLESTYEALKPSVIFTNRSKTSNNSKHNSSYLHYASPHNVLKMSAHPSAEERLWLQYYDICRQWAGQGTKVPDGQAIFASTSTWRSPVAGTDLPKIFSNKGIREVGDTLLYGDAIFYNPSTKGSYFKLVQK